MGMLVYYFAMRSNKY